MVKMDSNLYEHFNCKTKEELYQKVKDDDITVRSLVDFMEYSKVDMEGQKGIISPESLVEYVADVRMPNKNEVVGVFVNTKNIPVHVTRMESRSRDSYALGLKEGLNAGAVDMFIIGNNNNELHATNFFQTFDIKVVDRFSYFPTYQELCSMGDGSIHDIKNYKGDEGRYGLVSEIVTDDDYNEDVTTFDKFDEFSSYYSEQEIVGLHVFEDNKKIQESLKVGYQYDWQEAFGAIICNSKGEVVSLKEMFKGSPNATIVDRKVFTKELLSHEDVGYVVIYHNHPSGSPEPSDEDQQITSGLKVIGNALDVELLDHFIIGKEGVYSFAKEGHEQVVFNDEYKKAFEVSSKKSSKQMAFDLER